MHTRAVAAVSLLVLVVVATLAVLIVNQEEPPAPTPSPTQPSQRTLLVQVRDSALLAQGSVLMGIGGDAGLSELGWTADWWIDQLGTQEVSAAELGRKPVPYVIQTVESQAEVPVDDAWVMDRLAFAGLVDAVGGVRIDIPRRSAYLTEQGQPEILEKGIQDMSGAQAADYVLDASLRDGRKRKSRFDAVWDQVLRRFPGEAEKSRALVVSLGALSKSTMTTDSLADYLTAARDLLIAGEHSQTAVPLDRRNEVRVKPAQGVRRAYALAPERMARRMSRVFAGYPDLSAPVARIQASRIRNPEVEKARRALDINGWRTAWAGRVSQSETVAVVDPDVDAEAVAGLVEALEVEPVQQSLPWGQAWIDLGTNEPVGS